MAEDESVAAHLRLGALRELGRRRYAEKQSEPSAAPSPDGLPPDPLAERYPDPDPNAPRDPMADLDWETMVGRPPHRLYLKVLRWVPAHASRDELLSAEAEFLRRCRDLGLGGAHEVDELSPRRSRRNVTQAPPRSA